MLLAPFCACLILLLMTLLFDLKTKRLLSGRMQTLGKKALLSLWPVQVFIHIALFYIVASAPLLHKGHVTIRTSSRVAPGPFIPSIPPHVIDWRKMRVEHL